MHRAFNPPVAAAVLVLAIIAAATLGWLWLRNGRPDSLPPATLIIATCLPIMLPIMGALLFGSDDRAQLAVAIWAITMFASIIPGWYTFPADWNEQWRFLLAYGALWITLLTGFMLWLAPWIGHVPAPPEAAPVAEYRLKQRILSLTRTGLEIAVEQPMNDPAQLLVTRKFNDGKRQISVRLAFVAESSCIMVRETSIVAGDHPINANEARMTSGIRIETGSTPRAARVYERNLTMTIPNAATRRALALQFNDNRVEIATTPIATDPQNLVHVLTEIAHQSGWAWQGLIFSWQKGCARS